MMTKEQLKDLQIVMQEYNGLTGKPRLTKSEEQRCAYLQVAQAAIRSGMSLAELDEGELNRRERSMGLPESQLDRKTDNKETRQWQGIVSGNTREFRDMVEGLTSAQISSGGYAGLGYFVPTDFFPQLFASMKAHSPLYDDTSATVIHSTNGRPLPIPLADDTSVVADLISEAGNQVSVDIGSTSHAVLGAFSFSSPRFVASIEAFEDLDATLSATILAKRFFADRLARGISAYLINGVATTPKSEPLGLLASLDALDAPVVTALGAGANTGLSTAGNLASDSLSSEDFASALKLLDSAYHGPKTCFLMNAHTLYSLHFILDRVGQPINLVKYDLPDGKPRIYGVPVKIDPGMPDCGVSNTPVVLGDFSYFATRLVADETSGIVVYREAPGLIEYGNVGLRTFVRADCAVLWNGNGKSPFVQIRNFS